MLIAGAMLVFFAALLASWASAYWAFRWGAAALNTGRPKAFRIRRAALAAAAALCAPASAAAGFLGISAMLYFSQR